MKKLSCLFAALAVVLSDVMCFAVGWQYRNMLCGIEHAGYSAPASIAFLSAIPLAAGIVVCGALAVRFRRKES